MNIETFTALRNYAKRKITKDELLSSDKLFSYMREDRSMPGQSVIDIEFNNQQDFLEALGMRDDDVWFYQVINSPYNDYEFIDHYSSIEDFMEGYSFYYTLDEENKELLSEISKAILPSKVNFEDDEYRKELSEKLMENFGKQIKYVVEDYVDEKNRAFKISLEKVVNKEMDEYFSELGIDAYGEGFKITVADLLSLYINENAIHLPLKELLERVFHRKQAPGGWQEDFYAYEDPDDFDSSGFNRTANRFFSDILETIEEEGEDEGVSFKDFTDMTSRILKKFRQEEFYFLPKDSKKETRFQIEGFKFPEMKVVVRLSKGLKQKTILVSEQNFYNLLYQPSLFSLDEI
jgi:hypothetical protein